MQFFTTSHLCQYFLSTFDSFSELKHYSILEDKSANQERILNITSLLA